MLSTTTAAQVVIRAKDGKAVKHEGIKVEFVGSIGKTCAFGPPAPA